MSYFVSNNRYLSEYDFINGKGNANVNKSSSTSTNKLRVFISTEMHEKRHGTFLLMSAYFKFNFHPGIIQKQLKIHQTEIVINVETTYYIF